VTRPLTVCGTVVEATVDPQRADPVRRYLVRLRVDRVAAGSCDDDELLLLVHSPSKTFADPDPVGSSYLVTLDEPYRAPYRGDLTVTGPDGAG
jgi:hypothetical protein